MRLRYKLYTCSITPDHKKETSLCNEAMLIRSQRARVITGVICRVIIVTCARALHVDFYCSYIAETHARGEKEATLCSNPLLSGMCETE